MSKASQTDFYTALQARALPALRIVLDGERMELEESGGVCMEGSPKEAAKIIGLPVKEIYKLIDAGDIAARRPKANLERYKNKRDSLGRRVPLAIVVDLKDAFRIRFGREIAENIFRDFSLN